MMTPVRRGGRPPLLLAALPLLLLVVSVALRASPARAFSSTPLVAESSRDIRSMDDWSEACGVQRIPGFRFVEAPGSENELSSDSSGVDWEVATADAVEDGGPILRVPSKMIMSGVEAREQFGVLEEGEEMLMALEDGSTRGLPDLYLLTKVLYEVERGEDSPWFPWLKSLPRNFDNGASMTPFCFECLPPLTAKLASQERVEAINYYGALQKAECLYQETRQNRDLVRWAYNIVRTRSVQVDGDSRIVPVADYFNHNARPNCELVWDPDGNYMCCAIEDIAPGSPLRVCYADPTNPSYIFARYGFLDESSPATFCKIMDIKETPQLKDIGLSYDRMLFYTESGQVSSEVYDVLLYSILDERQEEMEKEIKALNKRMSNSGQDDGSTSESSVLGNAIFQKERELANCKNDHAIFYEACMRGDDAVKQSIHREYVVLTLDKLRKHVDNFLEKLDEYEAKARAKDIKENPRVPLVLRHNAFVREIFHRVRARL